MHLIRTGQEAPSYLADTVTQTATVSSRSRLRSGSSLSYEKPRTIGLLSFGNALSHMRHQLLGTVCSLHCINSPTPQCLSDGRNPNCFSKHFITSILNYAILVFFSSSLFCFFFILHYLCILLACILLYTTVHLV